MMSRRGAAPEDFEEEYNAVGRVAVSDDATTTRLAISSTTSTQSQSQQQQQQQQLKKPRIDLPSDGEEEDAEEEAMDVVGAEEGPERAVAEAEAEAKENKDRDRDRAGRAASSLEATLGVAAGAAAAAAAVDETAAKNINDPSDHDDESDDDADNAGGPTYDGSAVAAAVFADVYFYFSLLDADSHRTNRQRVLAEFTVRRAIKNFYDAGSQVHPLEAFAAAVGARYDRVKAYFYRTAGMKTRKRFAGIWFRNLFLGDFSDCDVPDVGAALLPLERRSATGAEGRTIDMRFLEGLTLPKDETFLIPQAVYVRDCMRTIFGLFKEDVGGRMDPGVCSTVLIGSPGVGKSILFFLAALYQARKAKVVFFRITKAVQETASMFFMMPLEDGTVRVWFSRNMRKGRIDKLSKCTDDLEKELGIKRGDYYLYIDGPHHTEGRFLVDGMYDYFCTSGGFPLYKGAEYGKRLWVLDGWTRDESVAGITALTKHDVSVAEHAYWICGGSIRDMLMACKTPKKMMSRLDHVIEQEDTKSMTVALLSSSRSKEPASPDTLRTMFMTPTGGDDDVMGTVQIVDSGYCLRELTDKLDIEAFVDSYKFCLKYSMNSGTGSFFERVIHQTVKNQLPLRAVKSVCWSEETAEESVTQLKEAGVYWIPSVSNFVSIDAALVDNHTLFVFQMTIAGGHDFNVVSFRDRFENKVKDTFKGHHAICKVIVYVVVPTGSRFTKSKLKFTDGTRKLKQTPNDIEVRIHQVDLNSPRLTIESIKDLFGMLGRRELGRSSSW